MFSNVRKSSVLWNYFCKKNTQASWKRTEICVWYFTIYLWRTISMEHVCIFVSQSFQFVVDFSLIKSLQMKCDEINTYVREKMVHYHSNSFFQHLPSSLWTSLSTNHCHFSPNIRLNMLKLNIIIQSFCANFFLATHRMLSLIQIVMEINYLRRQTNKKLSVRVSNKIVWIIHRVENFW